MPSKSKSQQRLMGQAYAYKTGKKKSKDLNPQYVDEIKDIAKSMTKKQLKDFAETDHKGLPQKVKESRIMNFESFVNESRYNDTKYVLVVYDKTVDGYPEKTAIIVGNDEIVDSIDFLFDKRGEYSEETIEKMGKYNISGRVVADDSKDLYMVDGTDISQEEALKLYLDHIETIKRINKFLTPEKEEELINLFRKRRK